MLDFASNRAKNLKTVILLSFDNLYALKYERLDIDWPLKDKGLMTKEEVENLFEIARSTGVKNVQWSIISR